MLQKLPLEIILRTTSMLNFRDVLALKHTSNFYQSIIYTNTQTVEILESNNSENFKEMVLKNTRVFNPKFEVSFRALTVLFRLAPDRLLNSFILQTTENNDYYLSLSCRFNRIDCVKLLLIQHYLKIDLDENEALEEASEFGNDEIVSLLLTDGRFNPDSGESECLQLAASNGHLKVVQILLDDGRCDPSSMDNFALVNSCRNGHLDVVKLLLESNTTPSIKCLCSASREGHLAIVKVLMDVLYRMTPGGLSRAFFVACEEGHLDIVQYMINEHPFSLNELKNAVSLAAEYRHLEIVLLLIGKDSSLESFGGACYSIYVGRWVSTQKNYKSAILDSIRAKNQEELEILLGFGIKFEYKRALDAAIERFNYPALKLLLEDDRISPNMAGNVILSGINVRDLLIVGDLSTVELIFNDNASVYT